MFWNKKIKEIEKIDSEEYKKLYHEIELMKIDISMLQKRKQKKLPLGNPAQDLKNQMLLPE